jgi:hypothetical protein
MSNPTGVLKKGAKPTAVFTFGNGIEVSVPITNIEYPVLSEWGKEGRMYRSYATKDEALERLSLVKRLLNEYASNFVDGYTVYVMGLKDDNTYSMVKKYVKGDK